MCIATVLQFHHHDGSGAVFFNLSPDKELALGSSSSSLVKECHHVSGHEHGNEEKAHCSLHFDKSVKEKSAQTLSPVSILSPGYHADLLSLPAVSDIFGIPVRITYHKLHTYLAVISSSGFRAPPF